MVNVDTLQQLIDSLEEALSRLESAYHSQDKDYVNRLRVVICVVPKDMRAVGGGSGCVQT